MRIAIAKTSLTMLTLLLATMPALAAGDLEHKIEVNKAIEMIGFVLEPSSPDTVEETEPNDDCTMPDPANPFDGLVNAAIYPGADEDWFEFSGMEGECVSIGTGVYNGYRLDTQLYLYSSSDCSTHLTWDDDSGPGLLSRIVDFPLPANGTYYIRVKEYNDLTRTGEYLLFATSGPCGPLTDPPTNDLCENAEVITCGMTVPGSTVVGNNNLDDTLQACAPYGTAGPDVFYELVVPTAHQMTAVLTPTMLWDCALWVVTDCADESTCVAGVDAGFSGDPEFLNWTNDSPDPVTLYIVADSYSAGVFGPFNLEVSCDPVVDPGPKVASEKSSWGSVKARF